MNQNEKRKKYLKIRLLIMIFSLLLPAFVVLVFELVSKDLLPGVSQFLYGFRYVMFGAFELGLIFKISVYIKMLKDEKFYYKMEIKKTDERNKTISHLAKSYTLQFVLYFQALVIVVMGFVNETAFYTLLASELFLIAANLAIHFYYSKKI